MPGENSSENTIEGNQKGRSTEMGRLKKGSPDKVTGTEVLMVSENVASWVWLTSLLGSSRFGVVVSEPVSWSYTWGCKEAIEVIRFRTLSRAIHSMGTDDWNYALFLIQGGNFLSVTLSFS